MVNKMRRNWIGQSVAALSALLVGCVAADNRAKDDAEVPPKDRSDQKAMLRYRFRGIRGGELRVDASFVTRTSLIYMDSGDLFNIGLGSFGPGGGAVSGYGGYVDGDRLAVPEYLRYIRYPEDVVRVGGRDIYKDGPSAYEGAPLVDMRVPIASRIPDEVLDRIRKYKGSSLALRLRITPDNLLVGWEIKLGKTYPSKMDKAGNAYTTDEDIMVGGDFLHARPRYLLQENGYTVMVHQKGWQIDPKSGRRIETDF